MKKKKLDQFIKRNQAVTNFRKKESEKKIELPPEDMKCSLFICQIKLSLILKQTFSQTYYTILTLVGSASITRIAACAGKITLT